MPHCIKNSFIDIFLNNSRYKKFNRIVKVKSSEPIEIPRLRSKDNVVYRELNKQSSPNI